MIVSVDCSDIRQYADKLEKAKFREKMSNVLIKNCQKAITNLKLVSPVDTGLLRKTWRIERVSKTETGLEAEILNDATRKVTYPSFVNYGHTLRNGLWWEGLHFMEEGIELSDLENNIRKDLIQAIEGELK